MTRPPAVREVELVACGPAMRRAVEALDRAAEREDAVILVGEPGVGRGRAARRLHAGGPFVRIGGQALAEPLLERALFGDGATPSAFERARGGTLFLEELDRLPLRLEVRLLAALEKEEDLRLVASSRAAADPDPTLGSFRGALLARIGPCVIEIPPLRDRPRDILPLARALLKELDEGAPAPVLSPSAERALVHHRWPGNVAELRNRLEGGLALAGGAALAEEDLGLGPPSSAPAPAELLSLAEVERRHIFAVLEATGGERRRAAAILGIGEATLYRKLARFGASPAPRSS